jgi:hypothetical protein
MIETKSIITLLEVWPGILAGVIDSQTIIFEKLLPRAGIQEYLRMIGHFRLIVFSYQLEDVVIEPSFLAGEIGTIDFYFLSWHVWKSPIRAGEGNVNRLSAIEIEVLAKYREGPASRASLRLKALIFLSILE